MDKSFYQKDNGVWILNGQILKHDADVNMIPNDVDNPTLVTINVNSQPEHTPMNDTLVTEIKDKTGSFYVDGAAFMEGVQDFFAKAGLQQAGVNLNGVGTQTIADADTWTEISPVGATFEITDDAKGFIRDIIESEIVHTGLNNTNYLFSGSTDLKSSMKTTVEFALVKNGDLLNPIAVSQHDFNAAQAVENFSINKDVKFNTGDRLNLYCRVGMANTILTIYSLNTSYWGDR